MARPPQTPSTASGAPGPYPAPRQHVIVADSPIPEPIGRRASRLIGTGTAAIALAGIGVLIMWLVLPETPVRRLILLTAAVCIVPGLLCIGVGLTVHIGLRYAREARRRQPPDPRPAVDQRRQRRPVVIDDSSPTRTAARIGGARRTEGER